MNPELISSQYSRDWQFDDVMSPMKQRSLLRACSSMGPRHMRYSDWDDDGGADKIADHIAIDPHTLD